jgi:hypothetical protein
MANADQPAGAATLRSGRTMRANGRVRAQSDAVVISFPEVMSAARQEPSATECLAAVREAHCGTGRTRVARRAGYGTGSAGFTRRTEKGRASRSNKRLRGATVILSPHTQPASAPRLPSPSWGRPEAAALLRSGLLQEGLVEPAGRPAFRAHRDGHAVCPCPFVGILPS